MTLAYNGTWGKALDPARGYLSFIAPQPGAPSPRCGASDDGHERATSFKGKWVPRGDQRAQASSRILAKSAVDVVEKCKKFS